MSCSFAFFPLILLPKKRVSPGKRKGSYRMEWFKFRMCWHKPLMLLSDEEAGKVIKAVVRYVASQEEGKTGGTGDILLCQVLETLQADVTAFRQKAEKKEDIRRKRSAAGRRSAELRRARTEKQAEQNDAGAGSAEHGSGCADVPEHMLNGVPVCSVLSDKNTESRNKNSETEKEKEKEAETEEYHFCSEPPSAVSELPVAEIPLNDGSMYPVFRSDREQYALLYPSVDIDQELRNIRGWCLANPARRKTRRGVKTFINSWLSRQQDRGGRQALPPENPFLAYARGEKDCGVVRL